MKGYIVLVGVANPDSVARLMRTAALIAKQFGGRVVAASTMTPPSATPPSERGRTDRMSHAEELLRQAAACAQQWAVPCETAVVVAQHIHEGLVDLAMAHQADMILVGFSAGEAPSPGAPDSFDRIIDGLAAHAPCHLLVAKYRDGERFARVLVPLASEINLDLTKDVVTALHHQVGAAINFVRFAASQEEAPRYLDELESWLSVRGMADCGTAAVHVHPEPAEAIVAATRNYDAVVVGAGPLHVLRRRLFGSIAEHVAEHAACTAYLARAHERPQGAAAQPRQRDEKGETTR